MFQIFADSLCRFSTRCEKYQPTTPVTKTMATQRQNGIGTEERLNPSLDAQSQDSEGVKASDATEEDKFNIEFDERGPAGLALRNHIIMEMIVNCLSYVDLVSWYESCKFVKIIIDEMGDSIWTTQVHQMECILWEIFEWDWEHDEKTENWRYPIKTNLDYDYDDPTPREQFDFLKTIIDGKVRLVKSKLFPENHGGSEIWDAAALAWHGVFGSMENLIIGGNVLDHWIDLSGCPDKHLCALISCGRNGVTIDHVDGINLSKILTAIKCRELELSNINEGSDGDSGPGLGIEDLEAVVRVMQSGVKSLCLSFRIGPDEPPPLEPLTTLTKYDGQGDCEEVKLIGTSSDEPYDEECQLRRFNNRIQVIKDWTQRINWEWDVTAPEWDAPWIRIRKSVHMNDVSVEELP